MECSVMVDPFGDFSRLTDSTNESNTTNSHAKNEEANSHHSDWNEGRVEPRLKTVVKPPKSGKSPTPTTTKKVPKDSLTSPTTALEKRKARAASATGAVTNGLVSTSLPPTAFASNNNSNSSRRNQLGEQKGRSLSVSILTDLFEQKNETTAGENSSSNITTASSSSRSKTPQPERETPRSKKKRLLVAKQSQSLLTLSLLTDKDGDSPPSSTSRGTSRGASVSRREQRKPRERRRQSQLTLSPTITADKATKLGSSSSQSLSLGIEEKRSQSRGRRPRSESTKAAARRLSRSEREPAARKATLEEVLTPTTVVKDTPSVKKATIAAGKDTLTNKTVNKTVNKAVNETSTATREATVSSAVVTNIDHLELNEKPHKHNPQPRRPSAGDETSSVTSRLHKFPSNAPRVTGPRHRHLSSSARELSLAGSTVPVLVPVSTKQQQEKQEKALAASTAPSTRRSRVSNKLHSSMSSFSTSGGLSPTQNQTGRRQLLSNKQPSSARSISLEDALLVMKQSKHHGGRKRSSLSVSDAAHRSRASRTDDTLKSRSKRSTSASGRSVSARTTAAMGLSVSGRSSLSTSDPSSRVRLLTSTFETESDKDIFVEPIQQFNALQSIMNGSTTVVSLESDDSDAESESSFLLVPSHKPRGASRSRKSRGRSSSKTRTPTHHHDSFQLSPHLKNLNLHLVGDNAALHQSSLVESDAPRRRSSTPAHSSNHRDPLSKASGRRRSSSRRSTEDRIMQRSLSRLSKKPSKKSERSHSLGGESRIMDKARHKRHLYRHSKSSLSTGGASSAASTSEAYEKQQNISPVETDKLTLQGFLGLSQITRLNDRLKNDKLSTDSSASTLHESQGSLSMSAKSCHPNLETSGLNSLLDGNASSSSLATTDRRHHRRPSSQSQRQSRRRRHSAGQDSLAQTLKHLEPMTTPSSAPVSPYDQRLS